MASVDNKKIVTEIVVDYGKLLKNEVDVKHIYLYGSYAKGTNNPDSDIDVAVVGDDFGEDIIKDTLLLMKIRRRVDTRIEPRPFRTADFSLSNPMAKEIINTGIKIL